VLWSVLGEPRRLRLEAINSTSVLVEWRPPAESDRRGVIRGYQVVYSPAANSSVRGLTANRPTHVLEVGDPGTWQAAVTGLLASTKYQFQVAAVGRKGVGERSRPRRVVTKGQGCFFIIINQSLGNVFIVVEVIKTTSRSTKVLTTERSPEQKSVQLMPERVDG